MEKQAEAVRCALNAVLSLQAARAKRKRGGRGGCSGSREKLSMTLFIGGLMPQPGEAGALRDAARRPEALA